MSETRAPWGFGDFRQVTSGKSGPMFSCHLPLNIARQGELLALGDMQLEVDV
jgi:hypothetical protein